MELPLFSASLGAMGSLARKLDALLDTQLKDEIEKLTARLLKLSKAHDPPHTARYWMKDVHELSYEMQNCVDAEPDRIDKLSGFKARLKAANGRYDRYNLESIPICTNFSDDRQRPMVDVQRRPDSAVVGLRDGPFDRLCLFLTDGDEQLKVLSIVGVAGIGKTTLVKQLWREKKLRAFDCRAFVRTAKKPDLRRILRSLLAQVRPRQPQEGTEVHELIHDIREHLQDKRYFLIIDDLWAISVWDVISHAFPEGNHSSRIITTTEIGDVAVACCTYQPKYIFKMEPLNFSHSKELFTSGVFGYGEEDYHQLDEASDEIVRRCAGLPLAIISIASVASQEEADAVQNRDETRERWLWKWVHKFVYSIMAAFSQTYHRINLIQPHKNSTTGGGVHNFILKSLPTNTTYGEKMKQVLNLCYNSLPICVQTCLLYLSLYPENYIILKEDIVKQWIAEGFILAPTEKDIMKVAGSYFDMLVNMGLIQHIDVDYSDEVLYYVVHHMVHGYITSKSIEANFITVLDYSQRTMRFSNKVSRLSLQFGSTRHATSPASTTTGLSQVWSLAFFGLMSCQPSIFGFKLLRSVILHIWADQPSTGVDLRRISELLLLRSLQVTCNDNVLLPDLMQGPKHLETLEINARVAYIPSNIIHLRSWLHLRLGVGTELPDVTGILPNVTQNPPISLDELSSPPNSVMTIELLPPICSIPKWIGHLTKLCSLKIVLRELDDISNLQGLPALTVLSLYVLRRTNTKPISFTTEGFAALEYFEFRCGVLCLTFEEGAMPSLQRIKLAFNAHGGEQNGCSFVGIEDMLSLQKISVLIGSAVGAEEPDLKFAESAVKKALGKHHSNVSIKRADRVEEEFDPPEKHHSIRGKHLSTSVEQPGSGKQEADTNSQLINRTSDKKEHAIVESRTDPLSSKEKFQENCSDIIRMTIHMGLFAHAKVVRLKSRHDKYLYADEDQLHVTQDRNGSSPNARWTVETVPHAPWAVRLRSCYGRYLAASSELFLLGMTGRKVLQVAPPPARRPDSSVEWEPVWDGFQERLRSRVGAGRGREGSSKYLRANAGIPPWRNSVTHDVPHRSSTHDWVLWDVEIVQVLTPGPATPAGPRPRRVDARPGLAARNQALQA